MALALATTPKTNRKHANKTQKSNPKQANLAYVHLEELLPPPGRFFTSCCGKLAGTCP